MKRSPRIRPFLAVLTCCLLVAACSSDDPSAAVPSAAPSERHTTEGEDMTTLVMGNALTDMPDQLIGWAAEVRRRTDETIVFDVRSRYGAELGADDLEQAVLSGVAAGDLDLGWVGARAVRVFEPLLAPMLVDSHDLQEEVLASGLATRMMGEMSIDGVTGLGLLPGPLRRLHGLTRDFRGPADFEGAVFIADRNAAMVEALETLGVAEVRPGAEENDLTDVDGFVGFVGATDSARSFTTNLNLSPRPLLLVINTAVLEGLAPRHRAALLESASDLLDEQMELTRAREALLPPERERLCSSRVELMELTPTELAVLEAAVEPVYERISEDPRSADHLREIILLKERLAAPPDAFRCEEDTG